MSMHLLILLVGLAALLLNLALVPVVRAAAIRFGLTDRPDSHRKLHNQPIPLGGGISIFLAFWLAVVLVVTLVPGLRENSIKNTSKFIGLFLGGAVIVAIGLLDDRFGLRGRHKLVGQVAAAALLMSFGYVIHGVSIFGLDVELGLISVPVTLGWLLLAINAVNLIDGADGLATTVGIILSSTLALLAILNGQVTEALLLTGLAGALLGFLRYNFPPARMYLGDAGSMLIGLSLGAMPITGLLKGPAAVGLAAPLAVWAVPVFDTAAAILRRKLTGRSIYETDRGHLHHCLLQVAGSQRRTLYLVVLACAGTCLGALTSVSLKSDSFALISVLSVIGVLVATRTFGYGELQLLAVRLRSFTQSLIPVPRFQHGHQHQAVRFQGSRPWEDLWTLLLECTDDFNLTRLSLDVNIPSSHEDFHVSWENPASDERAPAWRTEIPLCNGHRPLGRLVIAGLHDGFSACGLLAKLMDLLRPFELEFQETIDTRIAVEMGSSKSLSTVVPPPLVNGVAELEARPVDYLATKPSVLTG